MTSRKQTTLLKPFKMQQSKQIKLNCQICQSRFQKIVNRQHQCSECLRIICQKCGSGKGKVFYADGHSSTARCCIICVKQLQLITMMVTQNRLVFGQDSTLGQNWVKKLNKQKLGYQQILQEYNTKMFQTNNNTIKFKSQSARLIQDLFASYNYSLRQFMGKMTENIADKTVSQKVTNIMLAVYAYFKQLPYIKQLLYVVIFTCCFCNEFHCYFVITRFIQKVYPQYLRLQNLKKDNLLSHQLKMLIDMYKLMMKKTQKQQLDIIAMYLQARFTHLIKSFTINVTNVTISFFAFDQMMKNGSYIYLYKVISSILFNSREILCQWQDPIAIQENIMKNISIEQLKSTLIVFEKSNVKFQMEHQFFDSAQHRKLHEKFKQLESMYQKSEQKYKILQQKHKSLIKDYQQTMNKLNQNSRIVVNLQQEILSNASKLIILEDCQKYKEENNLLIKRNAYMNQELNNLRKTVEDMEKINAVEETNRRIFKKVQKDYEHQIVELKTKNQLYQLERRANDISFNTSFIDEQFQIKNKRIAELQAENNKISIQLDFYVNSRPGVVNQRSDRSMFGANISAIQNKNNSITNNTLNFSALQISTKQQKDTFKKYLEMSKQLTDKLKQDKKVSEQHRMQLQKQVKQLRDVIDKQKKDLQLNEQISNFINQIPQELNYSISIDDLQRIIHKQTNLHRKGQLQGVLSNFRKCLYEVRYRSIDAKLKQNKIKQLNNFTNTNQMIVSNTLPQPNVQISNDILTQKIQQNLSWIGNEAELSQINRTAIKKQQCQIM